MHDDGTWMEDGLILDGWMKIDFSIQELISMATYYKNAENPFTKKKQTSII
jgi:hypothetical protein